MVIGKRETEQLLRLNLEKLVVMPATMVLATLNVTTGDPTD